MAVSGATQREANVMEAKLSESAQVSGSTRERMAALLSQSPDMQPAEIARHLGVSRQNIHRISASLRRALEQGGKPAEPRMARRAPAKPAAPRGGPITPQRFAQCLTALGWSNRWLADYLGVSRATVDRWANGEAQIPETVAAWLEVRVRQAAVYALPDGWRVFVAEHYMYPFPV